MNCKISILISYRKTIQKCLFCHFDKKDSLFRDFQDFKQLSKMTTRTIISLSFWQSSLGGGYSLTWAIQVSLFHPSIVFSFVRWLVAYGKFDCILIWRFVGFLQSMLQCNPPLQACKGCVLLGCSLFFSQSQTNREFVARCLRCERIGTTHGRLCVCVDRINTRQPLSSSQIPT